MSGYPKRYTVTVDTLVDRMAWLVRVMPEPVGPSLGAQLLRRWQGDLKSIHACELLGLDTATYSRFVTGIRKPSLEMSVRIERMTSGKVPATSWLDPPHTETDDTPPPVVSRTRSSRRARRAS